jgi:hypothetical protein
LATWSKEAMACDSVMAPPDASKTSAARAQKPGSREVLEPEYCWRVCSAIVNAQRGSHVRRKVSSNTVLGEDICSMCRRAAERDVRDRTAAAVAARSRPFSICAPKRRRVEASRQPATQMAGRRQAPGGRGRPTDHGASGRVPLVGTPKGCGA